MFTELTQLLVYSIHSVKAELYNYSTTWYSVKYYSTRWCSAEYYSTRWHSVKY